MNKCSQSLRRAPALIPQYCNATCISGGSWLAKCAPGSQFFTSNGFFQVAAGVTSIRVLLVGGGAGGYSSNPSAGVEAVTLRAVLFL